MVSQKICGIDYKQLTQDKKDEVIESIKNEPQVQSLVMQHIQSRPKGKWTKLHYIKNDYSYEQGNQVHIPKANAKGVIHYHWTAIDRPTANLNTIRECMATDLINRLGVYTQKLKLIPSQYPDGMPKLLLDSTEVVGEWEEEYHDFSRKLQDGYLIEDGSPDLIGKPKTDNTIERLGSFKIIMLLLGDRDAVGTTGDNIGYLVDPEHPEHKTFVAIDRGHALKIGGGLFETDYMRFKNIQNDFSFTQPTRASDLISGAYKNFTIFDDTPFLEKMEGLLAIAKLKESGEDVAIFDEYSFRFNGHLKKELNFEKEIREIKEAYCERRDYILRVFEERLKFMDFERGRLALNILDCLEKHTSVTTRSSPNDMVELRYPRVVRRLKWSLERQGCFIFEAKKITKKLYQILIERCSPELLSELVFSPPFDEVSEGGIFGLCLKCNSDKLRELNKALDIWKQFENWKK